MPPALSGQRGFEVQTSFAVQIFRFVFQKSLRREMHRKAPAGGPAAAYLGTASVSMTGST